MLLLKVLLLHFRGQSLLSLLLHSLSSSHSCLLLHLALEFIHEGILHPGTLDSPHLLFKLHHVIIVIIHLLILLELLPSILHIL